MKKYWQKHIEEKSPVQLDQRILRAAADEISSLSNGNQRTQRRRAITWMSAAFLFVLGFGAFLRLKPSSPTAMTASTIDQELTEPEQRLALADREVLTEDLRLYEYLDVLQAWSKT